MLDFYQLSATQRPKKCQVDNLPYCRKCQMYCEDVAILICDRRIDGQVHAGDERREHYAALFAHERALRCDAAELPDHARQLLIVLQEHSNVNKFD